MAPQGHSAGTAHRDRLSENSNLERQGCSPFYQELIDDPFVDLVSGLRPAHVTVFNFSKSGHYLKQQKKKKI